MMNGDMAAMMGGMGLVWLLVIVVLGTRRRASYEEPVGTLVDKIRHLSPAGLAHIPSVAPSSAGYQVSDSIH